MRREKIFQIKPSKIYTYIDMVASKGRDELLASFGGDVEKAIRSLERSIRTLEEIGEKKEEAKKELEIAKRLFEAQGREEDMKKAEELLRSL